MVVVVARPMTAPARRPATTPVRGHRRRVVHRRGRGGGGRPVPGRLGVRVQPGHDEYDDQHGHHTDGGERCAQPARAVVDGVHRLVAAVPHERGLGHPDRTLTLTFTFTPTDQPPTCPGVVELHRLVRVGNRQGRRRQDGRGLEVGQANRPRTRDAKRTSLDTPLGPYRSPRHRSLQCPHRHRLGERRHPRDGIGSPRACAAGGGNARPSGRRPANAAGAARQPRRPRRRQRRSHR